MSLGEIGVPDSTPKADALENRLGVEIRGELSKVVKPGDVVVVGAHAANAAEPDHG